MEHKTIHVISRAIIIKDDHILLVYPPHWKNSMYYLPGGHIEPGEFAQDTLIRELKEEIGFDFEVDRYLGCMEYTFIPMPNEKVCHTHEYNFVFLAHSKMIKDTSPIPQREENVKLEWVKLSDLNKVKVLPEDLLKLLPIWLKEDHSTSLKSATG